VGAFRKVKVFVAKTDSQGVLEKDSRVVDGTYTDNIVWPEVLGHNVPPPAAAARTHHARGVDTETEGVDQQPAEAPCDRHSEDTILTEAVKEALEAATRDPLTEQERDELRALLGNAETQFQEDDAMAEASARNAAVGTATPSDAADHQLPPPSAIYPLPWERQVEMRCGRHALNNALGGEHAFSNDDLSNACDVVVAESLFPDNEGIAGDPQHRHDHEAADGWYSEAVLAMALRRTLQYRLLLEPLHVNPNVLEESRIAGAVVNKDNEHWVALRRVEGRIWLLDSTRQPRALHHEEYMAFIKRHLGWHYVYCLF
jgi:hypothetical protein